MSVICSRSMQVVSRGTVSDTFLKEPSRHLLPVQVFYFHKTGVGVQQAQSLRPHSPPFVMNCFLELFKVSQYRAALIWCGSIHLALGRISYRHISHKRTPQGPSYQRISKYKKFKSFVFIRCVRLPIVDQFARYWPASDVRAQILITNTLSLYFYTWVKH